MKLQISLQARRLRKLVGRRDRVAAACGQRGPNVGLAPPCTLRHALRTPQHLTPHIAHLTPHTPRTPHTSTPHTSTPRPAHLLDLQEAPLVLRGRHGLLEEVLDGLAVQVLQPVVLMERIDLLLAELGGVGPKRRVALVEPAQVRDHLRLARDLHRHHRAHRRQHARGRAHEAEAVAGPRVLLLVFNVLGMGVGGGGVNLDGF